MDRSSKSGDTVLDQQKYGTGTHIAALARALEAAEIPEQGLSATRNNEKGKPLTHTFL